MASGHGLGRSAISVLFGLLISLSGISNRYGLCVNCNGAVMSNVFPVISSISTENQDFFDVFRLCSPTSYYEISIANAAIVSTDSITHKLLSYRVQVCFCLPR